MKVNALLIRIHSLVDVVTNSSSELFIIHHQAKDALEEIIRTILTKHGYVFEKVFYPLQPLNFRNKKAVVSMIEDYTKKVPRDHLTFDGSTFVLKMAGDNALDNEALGELSYSLDCIRIHLG